MAGVNAVRMMASTAACSRILLSLCAIFTFTGAWNELLLALIFITSENKRTVPLGLNYLITGDVFLATGIGIAWLGERLDNAPPALLGQAISAAVLVAGVAVLARRGTQLRQEILQRTRDGQPPPG